MLLTYFSLAYSNEKQSSEQNLTTENLLINNFGIYLFFGSKKIAELFKKAQEPKTPEI